MAKYLDQNGLLYFWQKIVNKFVAKESGKGLSTNDYTQAEKEKLAGIEANANNYTLPTASAETLGGVKVGAGLTITQGVLSATGGGTADAVEWVNVQNKPNTISGYGITDAYTKAEVDAKNYLTSSDIADKADKATTLAGYGITDAYTKTQVYTKTEIDDKGFLVSSDIANKADKATTLSGYGITNAYTKTEVDSKLSSVYKPAGAVYFSALPTPSASNLGNVYSLLDAFTTDDRFIASEPTPYPIGTNVVVIQVDSVYYFDILAGFVDLSDYLTTSDVIAITNQEIDEIVA